MRLSWTIAAHAVYSIFFISFREIVKHGYAHVLQSSHSRQQLFYFFQPRGVFALNENIKIERNKFVIFSFLYLHSSRFNYLLSSICFFCLLSILLQLNSLRLSASTFRHQIAFNSNFLACKFHCEKIFYV